MASKHVTQTSGSEPPDLIEQVEIKQEVSEQESRMGELDKVRNILFGEQIRVYEERMLQIKKDLTKEISAVGSQLDEQIKVLDTRVQTQYDEILEILGKETHSRENQKEDLAREIGKISDVVADYKILQEEKLDTLTRALSATMESEKEGLQSEFHAQIERLSEEFREAIIRLEKGSLDRTQFSRLLAGMAQEILPGDNSK